MNVLISWKQPAVCPKSLQTPLTSCLRYCFHYPIWYSMLFIGHCWCNFSIFWLGQSKLDTITLVVRMKIYSYEIYIFNVSIENYQKTTRWNFLINNICGLWYIFLRLTLKVSPSGTCVSAELSEFEDNFLFWIDWVEFAFSISRIKEKLSFKYLSKFDHFHI